MKLLTIKQLVKMANHLDKINLFKEADILDQVLYKIANTAVETPVVVEIYGDTRYKYKHNGDGSFSAYYKGSNTPIATKSISGEDLLIAAKGDAGATQKIKDVLSKVREAYSNQTTTPLESSTAPEVTSSSNSSNSTQASGQQQQEETRDYNHTIIAKDGMPNIATDTIVKIHDKLAQLDPRSIKPETAGKASSQGIPLSRFDLLGEYRSKYGPKTSSAISSFQFSMGYNGPNPGAVDILTWKLLFDPSYESQRNSSYPPAAQVTAPTDRRIIGPRTRQVVS